MNGTSLTSRISTYAVIAVALGLALLQGKAFAQASETQDSTPSVSAPAAVVPSTPGVGTQEVAIVDAPGGNFGEGEDDEDGEDDEGYGEDDD